ncbi:MAG: SagB family peptide dehydrogenase [Hormoscilla sp. GUM202]|nr:SagB family peptide dehydrogenase [Hormoscilla sp. GUM202]
MPDLLLDFKKDISVIEEGDGVVMRSANSSFNLGQLSPGLVAALRQLADGGATEDRLADIVQETADAAALPMFYYYLQQFINMGIICYTVRADGLPLATLVPFSTAGQLEFPHVALDQKYTLSRFAYCRHEKGRAIVETPLFPAKIILADWRSAALLGELAQPQDCNTLTKIPGISADTVRSFFSLLLTAKMLDVASATENDTMTQWEFHDLLFHSRSRMGRHDYPSGKTHPFLDKIPPLPAVKPKMSDFSGTVRAIDLYKPDIPKLKAGDVPFTWVLEERKSIRNYGGNPITDKQLGEFLYRSARMRALRPSMTMMECSNRPYPGGGACYELELYLAVNTCDNIDSGLYHYCPQDHQLCHIADRNRQVEALLKNALGSSGEDELPQVLIILAARFQRVAWDYQSMAYSIILKHVGVLYQTMYLVATAMDLAPCGLGAGNADLFATAAGTDYYAESSVGEFMLGSKGK